MNLSRDHFSLHIGKNVRVIMEFMPTLSTDMVQRVLRWEKQKRCYDKKMQELMTKKYCYNKFLLKLSLEKRIRR